MTQNAQSTAQPVWEERQTVNFSTGGVECRVGAGRGARPARSARASVNSLTWANAVEPGM